MRVSGHRPSLRAVRSITPLYSLRICLFVSDLITVKTNSLGSPAGFESRPGRFPEGEWSDTPQVGFPTLAEFPLCRASARPFPSFCLSLVWKDEGLNTGVMG